MERKRGYTGKRERGKMDNGIKWKAKGEKRKYRKEEEDGRKGGGEREKLGT